MVIRKSNVKIENNKVVLSDEVLKFIESWRTEENSTLIDKYLEILNDFENINSKKFRYHHIVPCFIFKDETHKIREETELLANKIEGNIIKLSLSNHIIAHDILRRIFPKNNDAKMAVYVVSGALKGNIENITEEKIKQIAKIKEECSKENQTKEEILKNRRIHYYNNKEVISETRKKYRKEHREELSIERKIYYEENKDRCLKNQKRYDESHKEEIKEYKKKYVRENKERVSVYQKKYRKEHKNEDKWKEYHKNYKKNWRIENKEKSREYNKNYYMEHKDKYKEYYKQWEEEHREERKKQHEIYNTRGCIDPIKNEVCSYNALRKRIKKHKDDYKDLNPKDCIIESSISFEEFQKLDESTQQSLRNSVIKKLESIYPNLFTSQSADPTIFDL